MIAFGEGALRRVLIILSLFSDNDYSFSFMSSLCIFQMFSYHGSFLNTILPGHGN